MFELLWTNIREVTDPAQPAQIVLASKKTLKLWISWILYLCWISEDLLGSYHGRNVSNAPRLGIAPRYAHTNYWRGMGNLLPAATTHASRSLCQTMGTGRDWVRPNFIHSVYTTRMLQLLNWRCSKYVKVGRMHHFCTIALCVTSNASHSAYMRVVSCRFNSFVTHVSIFCWQYLMMF